ncbi:UDP-2,4-diacetamido-2,4,6-trideoxy-beta-L-altropyranose hydrolase [Singulisphaera sp. PoT]|uniref:UDP-2,4-diacetamido-2,4, 6-trideoxy-beta-L-altropyranose hydrolase n=1 Tax=Singulisphaera sp. PoT TaxID=3411797 RepID=UPI003BF5C598
MSSRDATLLIRTDAGPAIGFGHAMRCLALAQAWQDQGGRVVFAMSASVPSFEDRLQREGITFRQILADPGSEQDAASTLTLAEGASAIVLDGYHFTDSFQQTIKRGGIPLLAIDDDGHTSHRHADIVLNQNISAHEISYRSGPMFLLGTRYAMLRREFREATWIDRDFSKSASKILVTLGGGDPGLVLSNVIQALCRLHVRDVKIRLIAGPASGRLESLRQGREVLGSRLEILGAVEDMPAEIAWADIALTAAGSTCWELAFMGLPALTIVLAENQRGIARGMDAAGATRNLGWHQDLSASTLTEGLEALIEDHIARRSMSERGRTIVDGRGAERVCRQIKTLVAEHASSPTLQ